MDSLSELNERLVESFLSRVEALTPEQWGRLDARGVRTSGLSPQALLEHARLDAAVHGFGKRLDQSVATGAALAGRAAWWGFVGAFAGVQALKGKEQAAADAAERKRKVHELRDSNLHVQRRTKYYDRLIAAVNLPSGGADSGLSGLGAFWALNYGLRAVMSHGSLTAVDFETAYSIVEPIIPFASLDRSA